ncbi:aldolase [Peribacillus muralis]|uniref:aldolase n=1 Tax=Peribacillus muralis TaxID=264697 RepID=UPI001F4E22AE|nr:aldolase [Peribacillus muralis]MCK1993393.1 aldolase [Peribacillus muralis]MCK2014319.1 aldolase [Peribacillus muralis]
MLSTDKTYAYTSFGLTVASDIPLPELEKATGQEADVTIRRQDLSNEWGETDPLDRKGFIVDKNRVMFEVPELAVFLIEEGKTITVSFYEAGNENKVRLYLLGSCMGIVLMQRKILTLHGSAIAIDGKAYVFIGESGAGKSTLASSFMNKGYTLLSDDLIALSLKEGAPWVTPSYPQQKLWLESIHAFEMKETDYEPLFDRITKFSIPVQADFQNTPLPLGGIFELACEDIGAIQLQPIKKLDRLQVLHKHTYRRSIMERMGMMAWHFTYCAECLQSVSIHRIIRPTSAFTAHDLVDAITHVIQGRK